MVKTFHSTRFADDIVLIAESEEELNDMLHALDSKLTKYKSQINAKKTKAMIVSKINSVRAANIRVNKEPIELVNEFCYLGSLITHDGKSIKEIKKTYSTS